MSSQPPFPDEGCVANMASMAGLGGLGGLSGSGEVAHMHFLSDHIGKLFLSDDYSDVTILVGGQKFHAHRVILAARSEYFRALLFGGMRESQLKEVELKDTPLHAFRGLLKYIYTGHMTLSNQKDDQILDILCLAHQYGFNDLEKSISDYLRAVLSVRNVSLIFDTASLYSLQPLVQACLTFMDKQASEVIGHESFTGLSASSIEQIISRDSFCAPEVDIFKAIHKWVQANPEESEMSEKILASVRLSLMSTQDLLKVVRPTGLVPPDVMLDAIQSRTESRDMELKYRGCLIPEENVATSKHGAQVIQGEVKNALLDGDTRNYDMDHGFTRHSIDEETSGIVVQLGTQCIINHVRLLLWDREPRRSYSYMLDASMDQKDWVRVIDHSRFHCRSWQDLYFTPRVVRYLRVIGTYNNVNKVFHCVSLEAFYTKHQFDLDEHGILIPKENVATIPKRALVKEGVCRSRYALLNEDTSNYNWDSGYTCHQLGSGSIVVQLGQPYALDSMRLLLWDCDDRSYSYFIEVSKNEKDWEMVCDRSQVPCRSWQSITFSRRPVVYIRIVGTHNTANGVFHCVHFECPAVTSLQDPEPPSESGSSVSDDQDLNPRKDESSSTYANYRDREEDEEVQGAAGDSMSHHSSPASYTESVTECISANNSLPVGASACSIARQDPKGKIYSNSSSPEGGAKRAATSNCDPSFGSAQSLNEMAMANAALLTNGRQSWQSAERLEDWRRPRQQESGRGVRASSDVAEAGEVNGAIPRRGARSRANTQPASLEE